MPQVKLHGEWITIDATYDPPLRALGFIVNDWDGETSTELAEQPLSQKIEGQPDPIFDRERAEFHARLSQAYCNYPTELKTYQTKFNEWLSSTRRH